jgi:20S proteasome alpha/beta subunit
MGPGRARPAPPLRVVVVGAGRDPSFGTNAHTSSAPTTGRRARPRTPPPGRCERAKEHCGRGAFLREEAGVRASRASHSRTVVGPKMPSRALTPSSPRPFRSSPRSSPIVTGTSVLAVKYKDGVMVAADTLGASPFWSARATRPHPPSLTLSHFSPSPPAGSYGSLARYTELRRIRRIGDYTLLGAGGEYSDFQHILDVLGELVVGDHVRDDGAKLGAPEIHSYLTRVMYQRRNKGDPLYNTLVVAGFKDGKACVLDSTPQPSAISLPTSPHSSPIPPPPRRTLGYIDPIGTAFSDDYIATGYGAHLGLPLIRER